MKQSHTIVEIETAINFWRERRPSVGEEHTLCPEVDALAEIYGLMAFHHYDAVEDASLTERQRSALYSAYEALRP